MEIKPTYATFEQCKRLKEKGFDVKCDSHSVIRTGGVGKGEQFIHKGRLDYDDIYLEYVEENIPEQWQVIEWASLVHNIDIEARVVGYAGDIKTSYYQPYINGCIINISKFSTRQQAYSAAFDYILNNLI